MIYGRRCGVFPDGERPVKWRKSVAVMAATGGGRWWQGGSEYTLRLVQRPPGRISLRQGHQGTPFTLAYELP
ncbi:hypothetical protein CEXT_705831 [Caerostris extrusa]|uniref:Uncharacterized protein n=1 Tax=Caerostris extrusa TaxID=172846 RepID=A0AAV4RW62_CAEEX|nr:hypothetical protein CEXT_705831 [Caerostris extrusa]